MYTGAMKRHTVLAWFGVIFALLVGGLSGLVLHNTPDFKVTLAISIMAALLNILAVPFFLSGLKQFQIGLRRAYTVLCIGIVLFGIAQVQLPLENLLNWVFWVNSGGIAIPYLLGVLGIFWGMRMFARLFAIKGFWTSPITALLLTIGTSLVAAFLPHVTIETDETIFRLSVALAIANSIFITFATVLAYKIRNKIGALYKRSISWLASALVVLSFAGWHYVANLFLTKPGDWYYDYSITIVPFVVGAILLIVAGRIFDDVGSAFAEATRPEADLEQTTVLTPALTLEIVLYVASLAANPADVDVLLDRVRYITSGLRQNEEPSATDQQTLMNTYAQLETYMSQANDVLHTFSKKELHNRIIKQFRLDEASQQKLWGA